MPVKFSAALVLAAVLSLSFACPGFAAVAAGQVLTFNGECFVVAGGQRTALKMGDAVHVGDVLDVPQGAKLKLRMADGSVLSLASGTRMTIRNYDFDAGADKRDVKLGLDLGLVRAVVAKVSQPSTFEIDTATSVAAARSTDWFDQADANRTRVGVLDGSVSFAARDAKGNPEERGGVVVPAGDGSQIAAAPAATAHKGRRIVPPVSTPTPPQPLPKAEFDQMIAQTSIAALGWCQCIADITRIHASCQASVDACKAACGGGRNYSFIPDATQSCAPASAKTPSGGAPH